MAKPKPTFLAKLRQEFFFWIHAIIWFPVVLVPFFVPLWLTVIGFIIYQLHLILFNGCVISIWQQHHHIIKPGEEYYHAFVKRVFGYDLSTRQVFWLSRAVEYYVLIAAVVVYLIKN